MTAPAVVDRAPAVAAGVRRLLVTRQDPDDRTYHKVGVLQRAEDEYLFTYVPQDQRPAGFMPLPGLPDTSGTLRSPVLFAAFSQRLMSPRRPDYRASMDALGLLDVQDVAAPIEVLARSGGRRAGDLLEIVEIPQVGPGGQVELTFLVHGVRYQGEAAARVIDELDPGDELRLEPEPHNERDPDAIVVMDDGTPLGYVPMPLCETVHDVMSGDYSLRVDRANPRELGFHLRLLVTLRGRVTKKPLDDL